MATRAVWLTVFVLGVPGAAASLPSCAEGEEDVHVDCTLIGCNDGVTFEIPRQVFAGAALPLRVEACISQACREEVLGRLDVPSSGPLHVASWLSPEALDLERRHGAVITIEDGRGRRLLRYDTTVELMRIQPNGPRCEPVCHVATVKVPAPR